MKFVPSFAFAFLLVAVPVAHAAASQDTLPAVAAPSVQSSPANCGPSVDDDLKAARTAMAANDAGHDRAALVCLLAAVAALNAGRLDSVREIDHTHVLAVPDYHGNGQ